MDKRPEDITVYAKDAYIKFGDGYAAQIVFMQPSKDNNGNDVWDITMRPSEELIKAYNLRPKEDGTVIERKQIPYEFVVQLNPNPAWNWWFCLQTFTGDITPAIKKLLPTELLLEISKLKQEKEILRQQKEVAEETANLMQKNLPKYINRNIIPVLEGVIPLAEKLMPNKPLKND